MNIWKEKIEQEKEKNIEKATRNNERKKNISKNVATEEMDVLNWYSLCACILNEKLTPDKAMSKMGIIRHTQNEEGSV